MTFIVMAIQEEGSETRIGGEYDSRYEADAAADKAREEYLEYRQIWAEELRDAAYYSQQAAVTDYDDYDARMCTYGEEY